MLDVSILVYAISLYNGIYLYKRVCVGMVILMARTHVNKNMFNQWRGNAFYLNHLHNQLKLIVLLDFYLNRAKEVFTNFIHSIKRYT